MRTYSREHFEAARNAWRDGDFGPEWDHYRQLAADRGFIYPPEGSPYDDWSETDPSARAIIARAIDDTPKLLTAAILNSRSWPMVVARIVGGRDRMAEDADFRERQAKWDKEGELGPRESLGLLAGILDRIRDSAA